MPKKKIIVDEPDQDPTTATMSEARPAKVPKKDLKKYLVIMPPDTFDDLNAIVALRHLDRIREGGKAYTMNQLIMSLVYEYLDRPEIGDELAKARRVLGK